MQLFLNNMHVKTNCKHFKWKKTLFVSMNKINQDTLYKQDCDLNKLNKFLNCPENCESFENNDYR